MSVKSKGSRYSSKFKAEVAFKACSEAQTLSELSSEYGVSSAQICRWKKVLTDRASELFETSKPADIETLTDPLYKEIGRLKVELDWFKKNCGVQHV